MFTASDLECLRGDRRLFTGVGFRLGAGELLYRSDLSPATLRQNVTSPGGTTAAALDVLMADDGMKPLMRRAVAAAKRRAEELSG